MIIGIYLLNAKTSTTSNLEVTMDELYSHFKSLNDAKYHEDEFEDILENADINNDMLDSPITDTEIKATLDIFYRVITRCLTKY